MTSDEMLLELQKVYASLKALEEGSPIANETTSPPYTPKLTIKQAFKKDEVICMICNKGFKTLKRHLAQAHDLKPGQYRKQFNIPASISLTAKSYSESRRQTAIDNNLGDGLAKAREVRAAKKIVAPAVKTKATKAKEKAPVPAVKGKTQIPTVSKKTAVPAKVVKKK
jgi:predicted transcriptional regulator